MRKHMLKAVSVLAASALVLPSFINPIRVHAAEDATPTVVFSTIEGEGVEISISGAASKDTARTWYCNGEELVLDENHVDTSEGTTAKLKLTETSTRNHMDEYRCISSGNVQTDDYAKLYVISKDNYSEAELEIRDMEATIGSELYAKDLTVYIDKTPYPNFAPLQFIENGVPGDRIRVKNGTYTYELTDTVFGRRMNAVITGVGDKTPPSIKYLGIKGDKAEKYATQKTLEVSASDEESGLPEDAYYFEKDEKLASAMKTLILGGATADSLNGIDWSPDNKYTATDNGLYTVFVRDNAGNIAYKSLELTKISTRAPYITEAVLGKEDDRAYFKVSAKDPDNQPLQFRLNGKKWQESEKLFGVKEGENKIEVRNEAGVSAGTTRIVYLNVYLGKEEGFSEESLYNYINVSPATWTNKQVTVSLILPDSLTSKLASSPYSINGAAFQAGRSKTVSENAETVQFTVKDLYGNTHTSKTYTVSNIDKENPYLEVTVNEGTLTVKAGDSGSGIEKITVTSAGANGYVIKANSSDRVLSDTATYKAPANGSYQFTVYDYAGNTASATGVISFFTEENGTAQTAVKNSDTKTATLRTGTPGASVLGSKKVADMKAGTFSASQTISSKEDEAGQDDNVIYSDAGNSQSPDLPEAEKIEVIKEQNDAPAGSPLMLEENKVSNDNGKLLRWMFVLLLIVGCASVGIVVFINSGKKKQKERDDFSFRR